MKVKVMPMSDGGIVPKKGTDGAAAYDLYIHQDTLIEKGRQVIQLGFCMEIEEGYAAEIHPRSGFASKGIEGYRVIESNGKDYRNLESERFNADVIYGLIDADYRGIVGVIINNKSNNRFMLKKGTRIAQMLFVKTIDAEFEIVDSLSKTDRGGGGFGSTGV